MTFTLFLRSPIRFGTLLALLGVLDTTAVNLAKGFVVEKIWIDRLGTMALPLLWVVVSAVARGADDKRMTRQALKQLGRRSVWAGALAAGAILVTLNSMIAFALHGVRTSLGPHQSAAYLQTQGQFIASIEASVLLMSIFVGLCYFPLLVLGPAISPIDAVHLSRKANDMNGGGLLIVLVGILVLTAGALASSAPAYGMTSAAFLVFMGVLNYVAYRDIFERRSGNAPEVIAGPRVTAVATPARPQG